MKPTQTPGVPNLRIVPVSNVHPHEEHDHQRSDPLMKRIAEDSSWLNPPIVAPIPSADEEQYVVLDGANRTYSLKRLGIPFILVQVVDYHGVDVQLETWDHVLSDVETDSFVPAIHQIEHVQAVEGDRATAEAALDLGAAIAYLHILDDQQILILKTDQDDIKVRTAMLRQLVNIYKNIAKIDRFNGDNLEVIRKLHPNAAAVVVFPQYQPEDIIHAAQDGFHLPPGISRHIIQGRAMRLHYPLAILKDTTESLEKKNADLLRWIQARVAKKNMRLYAEATYMFDE